MATNAHTERWAHRAGCKVGRVWRGAVHQEQRAVLWFVRRGWPAGLAKVMLWAFKLIVLGVLLYVAFWLALVLVFGFLVAWVLCSQDGDEPEELAIGEQADHKNNLGYDPILYNDVPDPKYGDD